MHLCGEAEGGGQGALQAAGDEPELPQGRPQPANTLTIVLGAGTEMAHRQTFAVTGSSASPSVTPWAHLCVHSGRQISSSPRQTAVKMHRLLKSSQEVLSTWEEEFQCDLCSFPTNETGGVGTKVLVDTILYHA